MVQLSFDIKDNKLIYAKNNANLSSKIKYDPILNTDLLNSRRYNKTPHNMFNIQNRRYLGNKFKLSEFIEWVIQNNCNNIHSVADIFAGTGVVSDLFNSENKKVIVNDILYSNYLIYKTFFDSTKYNDAKIKNFISLFNTENPTDDNYFSENFGNSYFSIENARKIGFIRDTIEENEQNLNLREKAILITSLIYATDKVANTCGHYDTYRKKLDSTQPIKLLLPNIPPNKNNESNEIYNMDANNLVKKINPDLVYIDPPYNSRQYGDSYHLLENIATWTKPDLVGVAKKMKDRKKTKSNYCTVKAPKTFEKLINDINAQYILVSYNNMAKKGCGRSNAKISEEEILEILNKKGDVKVFYSDYKAFNTGKTNISNHQELLYLTEVK